MSDTEEAKQAKPRKKNYKKFKKYHDKLAQRGVVYLPQIPNFMSANSLRNRFLKFGVQRIYLVPKYSKKDAENDKLKKKEKKWNKYKEGWMEFERK